MNSGDAEMFSKRTVAFIAGITVVGALLLICTFFVRRTCRSENIPPETLSKNRNQALSFPIIAENQDALSHVCYSIVTGAFKTLEICEGDYTDEMMRRAEVVNEFHKRVCDKKQLEEIIRQSAGHNYHFAVKTVVDERQ